MGLASETDIALNEAQADDAGMAGIRHCGMRVYKKRTKENEQKERNQFAATHIHPLTGRDLQSLDD